MMSIQQHPLSYHTLSTLKAEQDELKHPVLSPPVTHIQAPIGDHSTPEDSFQKSPLPTSTETAPQKFSLLHPFQRPKKKKDPPQKLEVSPELVALAVAAYASTLNPAAAAGLTAKIDSQFFWNFTMLDFVGMAFPRISRSLQRGALPYDPAQDPEAQKRHGLDRWRYIKHQQVQNANWLNLREEMLRELQAAPGSLLVPTIVFSLIPLLSRQKALNWMGRRSLQMSHHLAEQESASQQHFLKTKTPRLPQHEKDIHALEALGRDYVRTIFKSLPESHLHENLDLTLTAKTIMDPYFHMSTGHLKTLKEGLKKGELFGLQEQLAQATTLNTKTPLTLKNVTLSKIIEEIADTQGKLLAFDVQHGAGSIFFNRKRRGEHGLLTAKMQALYTLAEQSTLTLNAQHLPQQRMHKGMTLLPLLAGHQAEQVPILERLRQLDKGRDLWTASLREYLKPNQSKPFEQIMAQALEKMKATKAVLTLAALAWMLGWMWYLSHAIQRGEEYPANRLVSLSLKKKSEEKNPPEETVPPPPSLYHQIKEGDLAS
jgi:hypothetical protein